MGGKIAIIGGGGRVGANAAFALQAAGVGREIALVDANAEMAAGEALDLMHGSALAADQRVYACEAAQAADADVICITAGSRRKPDESRLDLINRNVSIFRGILDELREAGLRRDAILFVVSNPVDILTRLAIEHLSWPPAQALGLGTVLDSVRFQSLIAEATGYAPTQVNALMLGEHGDTMTPIWSSATAGGIALTSLLKPHEQNRLVERTRGSGAEVIQRKGGAGYAVGVSVRAVIESILGDRRRMLPVCTRMSGQHGIRKVCLSLPTVVGRAGVIEAREHDGWPKEVSGIQASGRALEQTWSEIEKA
jgi:L-lactate dehydrogenase